MAERILDIGVSPSGKATGFDPVIFFAGSNPATPAICPKPALDVKRKK